MHKNYCTYPADSCDCGYDEKQDRHSYWCSYPKDPCSCNYGYSPREIDHGKKKKEE